MKKKIIFGIILALFVLIVLLIIQMLPSKAPETFYVKVTDPDGKPALDAICKADIITENNKTEDVPLNKSDIKGDCFSESCQKTRDQLYRLDTGLKDYRGKFEINIVCITKKGVSYIILNNTNAPNEVLDEGKFIRRIS